MKHRLLIADELLVFDRFINTGSSLGNDERAQIIRAPHAVKVICQEDILSRS